LGFGTAPVIIDRFLNNFEIGAALFSTNGLIAGMCGMCAIDG